jgi:tetratricopeptide (TPR) repeat protein
MPQRIRRDHPAIAGGPRTERRRAEARHFFEAAVRLDPTFSRAYAGLSFTHFQGAFQGWEDRALAVDQAYEVAGQSLMADDRDPAAHWAMGAHCGCAANNCRASPMLGQAVELSPNFALGHYTLSFVLSQAGDPAAAIAAADTARSLSPCDPLLFGMLGARAMALVRQASSRKRQAGRYRRRRARTRTSTFARSQPSALHLRDRWTRHARTPRRIGTATRAIASPISCARSASMTKAK